MIAEVLRGAADILNAAARAYDEQRTDLSDSELLIRAAIAVDHAANAATTVVWTTELLNLADELRDRAAQFAAIEATDTP
ncbi:hypothetical protein EB74_34030 [Mycobacterium sp. SWH-M5]|nr:hypothetical protein EB74_34030 [Mycobacterium sp. SWH-M5]